MNNYRFKIISAFLFVTAFLSAFFYEPSVMSGGVSKGLTICGTTAIPSLFPFVVLSDFLIRSGLSDTIGRKTARLTEKVFRLPGCASCVIIMSLIGGFPVGAKMTAQLIDNGDISSDDGGRMMLFCVNGGPAFIIGAVGASMLSSRRAGVILYVSLVLTSLFTGILSRFFSCEHTDKKMRMVSNFDSGAIIKSVSDGTATMLNICAWILLFSCLSAYAALLPVGDSGLIWINMASEVTNGCLSAVGKFPVCIMALVLGWSGFAVHCQVLPYIKKTSLGFIRFMLFRLINGGIATLIAWTLFKIFPCDVSVFSSGTQIISAPYSVSVPAAAAMLFLGSLAVLDAGKLRAKI